MEGTIQVNFNRPLPLFPLSQVVLLPHTVQHLHIFEKRYRQMVSHCLDQSGQIALATYADGEGDPGTPETARRLRRAVCVGQIIQHQALADGRYNILVVGVCRAAIEHVDEPRGERLYRMARLTLLDHLNHEADLSDVREQLRGLLTAPTLSSVRGVKGVAQLLQREDISTTAALEAIGSTLVEDPSVRYELLASPDPQRRAAIIRRELRSMDRLIRSAQWQMQANWPKYLSWN